jgi:hypothetical protein
MTDRGKDDRLGFVHCGAEILRRKLLRMTDKGERTGHVILRDKRWNGKTLRKYG